MTAGKDSPVGILLDIDGVLYVGDEPIHGAHQALLELRELGAGVRLMTNTTSRSRRAVHEHLLGLRFDVSLEEVLTPAAMAERHCHERGYGSVSVLVSEGLREDLAALESSSLGPDVDAVILGDLGDGFTPEVLNAVFRALMDGAELVALQHNRYWRRADGLALDVGAYSAALEYASGTEAVTVGKPARAFFQAAMADLGLERGVMIGDDLEADVGGAMAAGLAGVLVRTGKYRQEAVTARVTPTAIVDSIKDVPRLLMRMLPAFGRPRGPAGQSDTRTAIRTAVAANVQRWRRLGPVKPPRSPADSG
jgi:HAD superfamily hydrolase (TIGR01458 family)